MHLSFQSTFIFLLFSILGLANALSADRPNVLVILADDMGYSDLGSFGSEIATPNLDQLAHEGLRFTQFYNTARCWPTRGALMTGYYAQQIRRDSFPDVDGGGIKNRPDWAPLLSTRLKALGYRTYHSGKWHIDGLPLQNGFDHSYSLNDHNRNFSPNNHTEDDRPLPPADPKSGYYTSTAIADHLIRLLRDHAENHAGQAFFGYLCFTSPHFPLQAPAEDIARYKGVFSRGWDAMREERWKRMRQLGIYDGTLSPVERDVGPPYNFPDDLKKYGPLEVNRPVPWQSLSDAQRDFEASKMAIHAAMIDRMDREIGRVLAQLRTMQALDNTLVLFLSDNGASAEIMVRGDGHTPAAPAGSAATFLCLGPGWSTFANTPFRRHKTWVHEGGISTSLIVHWPAGIAAHGELRHTPGHVIDIVPTVLELAQGSVASKNDDLAHPFPGRSLVPAFARNVSIPRDSLWFFHEGNRALRVGDWKVVATAKSDWELYNLATDRSETHNLALQNIAKVRELSEIWSRQTGEYRRDASERLPAELKKQ